MCFGMIGIFELGFGVCGVFRVMIMVLLFGVLIVLKLEIRLLLVVLRVGMVIIWLYVYFILVEVMGLLFDYIRLFWRVKV